MPTHQDRVNEVVGMSRKLFGVTARGEFQDFGGRARATLDIGDVGRALHASPPHEAGSVNPARKINSNELRLPRRFVRVAAWVLAISLIVWCEAYVVVLFDCSGLGAFARSLNEGYSA